MHQCESAIKWHHHISEYLISWDIRITAWRTNFSLLCSARVGFLHSALDTAFQKKQRKEREKKEEKKKTG